MVAGNSGQQRATHVRNFTRTSVYGGGSVGDSINNLLHCVLQQEGDTGTLWT